MAFQVCHDYRDTHPTIEQIVDKKASLDDSESSDVLDNLELGVRDLELISEKVKVLSKVRLKIEKLKVANESLLRACDIKAMRSAANGGGDHFPSGSSILNQNDRKEIRNEKRDSLLHHTKLYKAVYYGNENAIKKHIKRFKKDINTLTIDGWSLLHVAVKRDHRKIVTILLESGADANQILDATKTNVRHVHTAAANGNSEILKALVAYGADINAILIDGCTPLHIAVKFDHIETVTTLLELGARTNIRSITDTKSPLDEAIERGVKAIIEKLINVCQCCASRNNLFMCCCGHVKYCSKECMEQENEFHGDLCSLRQRTSTLRFQIGDIVKVILAKDEILHATVVSHWYKVSDEDGDFFAPYRVRIIEKTANGRFDALVYVPDDNDDFIQIPDGKYVKKKITPKNWQMLR